MGKWGDKQDEWLNTFRIISGLSSEEILEKCCWLPLEDDTILHFYMHQGRFPTDAEAYFIWDVGLSNYICLVNNGIIPA